MGQRWPGTTQAGRPWRAPSSCREQAALPQSGDNPARRARRKRHTLAWRRARAGHRRTRTSLHIFAAMRTAIAPSSSITTSGPTTVRICTASPILALRKGARQAEAGVPHHARARPAQGAPKPPLAEDVRLLQPRRALREERAPKAVPSRCSHGPRVAQRRCPRSVIAPPPPALRPRGAGGAPARALTQATSRTHAKKQSKQPSPAGESVSLSPAPDHPAARRGCEPPAFSPPPPPPRLLTQVPAARLASAGKQATPRASRTACERTE